MSKCITKSVGKGNSFQSVVVFVEPIELIFSGVNTKIGSPKEAVTQEGYSMVPKMPNILLKIPETVIRMHVDAEPHEIIYQDGGHSTLNELFPFMRGCWRIKVRCRYKSEEKKWQNAKGEGSLIHLELTDREGSKMQATLFKEMIKEHGEKFRVGGVYEIA